MQASSLPNLIPQNPALMTPGQPAPALLSIVNSDGTVINAPFQMPPGSSTGPISRLDGSPTSFMTTTQTSDFISVSKYMLENDIPGVGMHLNGNSGNALCVYGPTGGYQYLDILTKTTSLPTILRSAGSQQNLTTQIFQSNIVDGQTVVFPTAFGGSQVWVVGIPMNGVGVIAYTPAAPSNASFVINALQVQNNGTISRLTTAATMNFIAIGTHA